MGTGTGRESQLEAPAGKNQSPGSGKPAEKTGKVMVSGARRARCVRRV